MNPLSAVLTLAALMIAGPVLAREQAPKTEKVFVCDVTVVRDGDTFTCRGGLRVRVWGVDAPEIDTLAGQQSGRALRLLISGQTLQCERRGKSWNRVVARCFVGGRDVAAEMVRRGQASDWPRYSKGFYAEAGRR